MLTCNIYNSDAARLRERRERTAARIALADLVLLNKTDLVTGEALDVVEAETRALFTAAMAFQTSFRCCATYAIWRCSTPMTAPTTSTP